MSRETSFEPKWIITVKKLYFCIVDDVLLGIKFFIKYKYREEFQKTKKKMFSKFESNLVICNEKNIIFYFNGY